MTTTDQILKQLNNYDGDNIWEDIIYNYADETATDAIDIGASDRFATDDGTIIAYAEQTCTWVEVDEA